MVRHVNLIYDDETQRDVFSSDRIDVMEANELITLIESKETARDATGEIYAHSVSQYKNRQKRRKQPAVPPASANNHVCDLTHTPSVSRI